MAASALRIGIERGEGWLLGWAFDLPGCVIGTGTEAGFEAQADRTIAGHLRWLAANGIPAPSFASWKVVEEIDSRAFAETGGEFCFAADREPLSRNAFEAHLEVLEAARQDLLQAADGLAEAELHWRPPASNRAGNDPWAPEPRTIAEILTHVLQLEVYYRDGLRDGSAAGIFEPVTDASRERERTREALRRAHTSAQTSFWPVRPSRSAAEEWTVRKALRRMVAHDLAHADETRERRAALY